MFLKSELIKFMYIRKLCTVCVHVSTCGLSIIFYKFRIFTAYVCNLLKLNVSKYDPILCIKSTHNNIMVNEEIYPPNYLPTTI